MKELKFIHITKTAGTTIEKISKKHNLEWGQYHIEYGDYHEVFPRKPKTLKNKYEWFTVVRNPYTRILSQFHYDMTRERFIKNYKLNDYNKERMNEHIQYKIKTRSKTGFHYTEQYLYLDNTVQINILHFENLKEEFENLMIKYNLDIKFDEHYNKSEKMFDISDFSNETMELINTVYKKDFEIFGYTIIS